MANTSIEWTDKTWNPLRGCSMAKGSKTGGCLNCYAARMASRNLPELKSPTTGDPFARIMPSGPRWTGKVELIESALLNPMKWRKPQRVFVNSMSDLFHESVPDEWIDRIFAVMSLCPQHTFQILTKRSDRMRKYLKTSPEVLGWPDMVEFGGAHSRVFAAMVAMLPKVSANTLNDAAAYQENNYPDGDGFIRRWPLPNIWLGVSCEDQKTANWRIQDLLATPATKRFISYEPALGLVDFDSEELDGLHALGCGDSQCANVLPGCRGLDWIIVGGESGPGARPFDITWARTVIRQCHDAKIACFVKQLGANPVLPVSGVDPNHTIAYPVTSLKLNDRKGGTMEDWPADLRVREFPI